MNLYNDYAAFTDTTAVYPEQVATEYLTLGLCSESAECVEIQSGRMNVTQYGNVIGKELGDVQWYVARLCRVYSFDFADVVRDAKSTYQPTFANDIDSLLKNITVQSGLVAGKVKKQLRDGATWTGEQREDVRQYVRDRLVEVIKTTMNVSDWMYSNHCDEYNSYDKILKMNRRKLEGRVERGTIRGSGDDR